jgi:hypothetical protein
MERAMETYMVLRRRSSYIFYKVGSQMALRLSILCAGCVSAPEEFLITV